jgi:hypothetical protein
MLYGEPLRSGEAQLARNLHHVAPGHTESERHQQQIEETNDLEDSRLISAYRPEVLGGAALARVKPPTIRG